MKDDNRSIEESFIDGDLLLNDIDEILGDSPPSEQESENFSDDEAQDEPVETFEQQTDDVIEDLPPPPAESSQEEDVPVEGNEFFVLGNVWKESGLLPQNAELKPDMTSQELEAMYRQAADERNKSELRAEIGNKLEALGVDPDEVFTDEFKNERMFQRQYEAIGNMTYEDMQAKTDDVQKVLRSLGMEYYYSKSDDKLDEDEIKALVDKDLNDNYEEDLFNKYQDYFSQRATQIREYIEQTKAQKQQQRAAEAQKNREYVEKQLKSGGLGNRQLSDAEIKKVADGMFKKDQVYVNKRGDRMRVTLFEKKRLEARDDLDKQLSLAAQIILGVNEPAIKEKSERVGAMKLLDGIAKASGVTEIIDSKKNSNQQKTGLEEFFLHD